VHAVYCTQVDYPVQYPLAHLSTPNQANACDNHIYEINIAHLRSPKTLLPKIHTLGSLGKWSRALKLSQAQARSRPSLLRHDRGRIQANYCISTSEPVSFVNRHIQQIRDQPRLLLACAPPPRKHADNHLHVCTCKRSLAYGREACCALFLPSFLAFLLVRLKCYSSTVPSPACIPFSAEPSCRYIHISCEAALNGSRILIGGNESRILRARLARKGLRLSSVRYCASSRQPPAHGCVPRFGSFLFSVDERLPFQPRLWLPFCCW